MFKVYIRVPLFQLLLTEMGGNILQNLEYGTDALLCVSTKGTNLELKNSIKKRNSFFLFKNIIH
ncbi:MAG: hypothetical protein A2099_03235 [Planctomycetes bacterium GWF2_39_10]|nr:MAG: hypothetical protein A2Y09_02630 [Planctomycetes bacterium GWA2_39_15]OHB41099.1 MAG: hypothetical protein A2Y11_00525 [Planctomycetes bacterium GWC2_39_26]OHB46641.1 MAG: hypothetical protein A2099_03235 [Planctomycetes bacterium GWF2_39_10]OHB99725.1 MAG: hypothetical protein A3G70_08280 [Planctomycetes bacterium RIFCSPLOWO2_12_FULL_39_13]